MAPSAHTAGAFDTKLVPRELLSVKVDDTFVYLVDYWVLHDRC